LELEIKRGQGPFNSKDEEKILLKEKDVLDLMKVILNENSTNK